MPKENLKRILEWPHTRKICKERQSELIEKAKRVKLTTVEAITLENLNRELKDR